MPHLIKLTEIKYPAGAPVDLPSELEFGIDENIDKEFIEKELIDHVKEYTGHDVESFQYDWKYVKILEE
jgi:hypothetical protein